MNSFFLLLTQLHPQNIAWSGSDSFWQMYQITWIPKWVKVLLKLWDPGVKMKKNCCTNFVPNIVVATRDMKATLFLMLKISIVWFWEGTLPVLKPSYLPANVKEIFVIFEPRTFFVYYKKSKETTFKKKLYLHC